MASTSQIFVILREGNREVGRQGPYTDVQSANADARALRTMARPGCRVTVDHIPVSIHRSNPDAPAAWLEHSVRDRLSNAIDRVMRYSTDFSKPALLSTVLQLAGLRRRSSDPDVVSAIDSLLTDRGMRLSGDQIVRVTRSNPKEPTQPKPKPAGGSIKVRFQSPVKQYIDSVEIDGQPVYQFQKSHSCGAVVIRDDGYVLLREPTNHFDQYVWTHAKGGMDPGETEEQAALREVKEETGWDVTLIQKLPGEFLGGTTKNVYFLASPIAQTGQPDHETWKVEWYEPNAAVSAIALTQNPRRDRDYAVLIAGVNLWRKMKGMPAWQAPPLPPLPLLEKKGQSGSGHHQSTHSSHSTSGAYSAGKPYVPSTGPSWEEDDDPWAGVFKGKK